VGHDAVTFRGILSHAGDAEAATVRIHWGPKDGGSDAAAWGSTETLEARKPGDISMVKTGLSPGTAYFCRLCATDGRATSWSARSVAFRTHEAMEIDSGSVQWPKDTSAYFHTKLPYSAGGKAEVTFFWGTKDGGTDAKAWEHALSAGPRDPGDHLIEINCEGLKPATTYFVRAFAKSPQGEKWAGRTLRFKTQDASKAGAK